MIWFLWQCLKFYRIAGKNPEEVLYVADLGHHGVTQFTMLLASQRSAWKVSQFAAEFFMQEIPK